MKIVIAGAGPAGLTAAYELLKNGYEVVVFEKSSCIGGISKTVNYNGNRMDMGGHRFFSKDERVNKWWTEMIPPQSAPAKDDILLGRECNLSADGADPEKTDLVMLRRKRVSRILFDSKFYDYPISLTPELFINMGFVNTLQCGFGYMKSLFHKLPEDNLENFYINRFGKKLYSMFFEYYTQNLWGRHPKEIDASWGSQRVKGISVSTVLRDAFSRMFHMKRKYVETSLIEEFQYPKFGPGQLWETVATKIEQLGGIIIREAQVVNIEVDKDGRIESIAYVKSGIRKEEKTDCFMSSMPLKDLVASMKRVPDNIRRIAEGLPYRDYITLGVLVKNLNLKNNTKMKTVGNIIPDCWIYVQDRMVKLGRIQIYNNWSPYMVKDFENTIWIGLEYFVTENDEMWNMNEDEFAEFGISEMLKLGIINNRKQVLDTHAEKIQKAYPAYFDTYSEIDRLIDYLNGIDNLYCIGRNGQHRYNNMDHSMCTAFEAVKNIISGSRDKSNIWNVNTEREYHENTVQKR